MGKELFPPLFRKHGSAFMINMGPLGGWNLALNRASDICECLSRADDFEVCVPGMLSCIKPHVIQRAMTSTASGSHHSVETFYERASFSICCTCELHNLYCEDS